MATTGARLMKGGRSPSCVTRLGMTRKTTGTNIRIKERCFVRRERVGATAMRESREAHFLRGAGASAAAREHPRVCRGCVEAGAKASGGSRERMGRRLASSGNGEVETKDGEAAEDAGVRQLLGMKGAGDEDNIWKIRLQLMKPVTWVPLVWGVLCGAAASGGFEWTLTDVAKSLVCMTMSGPCLTGYTQTINDYYDREIDAINEPYRPIPSGKISENEVVAQIFILLFAGLGLSYGLDKWAGHDFPIMLVLAIFGSLVSYIYSAPPLKLKQSGWIGNYALGSSYIALPWWAGQALFGELSLDVMVLTVLYSFAGLGIAIVNDFKSIEGDRQMGLQSLPVAFGVDTAKWICVGTIDLTQIAVASYLLATNDQPLYAYALFALILPQIVFQFLYFLPDPIENDVKYQASAQPFLVREGILVLHPTAPHPQPPFDCCHSGSGLPLSWQLFLHTHRWMASCSLIAPMPVSLEFSHTPLLCFHRHTPVVLLCAPNGHHAGSWYLDHWFGCGAHEHDGSGGDVS